MKRYTRSERSVIVLSGDARSASVVPLSSITPVEVDTAFKPIWQQFVAVARSAPSAQALDDHPTVIAVNDFIRLHSCDDQFGSSVLGLRARYRDFIAQQFGEDQVLGFLSRNKYPIDQLKDIDSLIDEMVAHVDDVADLNEFIFGIPLMKFWDATVALKARAILDEERLGKWVWRMGMAIRQRFGEEEARNFFTCCRNIFFRDRITIPKHYETAALQGIAPEIIAARGSAGPDIEITLAHLRDLIVPMDSFTELDGHPIWGDISKYLAMLTPRNDKEELGRVYVKIGQILGEKFGTNFREEIAKMCYRNLAPDVSVERTSALVDRLVSKIYQASDLQKDVIESHEIQDWRRAMDVLLAKGQVSSEQVVDWVIQVGIAFKEKGGSRWAEEYCEGLGRFLSRRKITFEPHYRQAILNGKADADNPAGGWN